MPPKEYDCMSYYDLGQKISGFKQRQSYELDIIRQHAFLTTIAPHRDPKRLKNLTVDKLWPVSDKEKTDGKKIPDEKRARIAKALKQDAENRDNT